MLCQFLYPTFISLRLKIYQISQQNLSVSRCQYSQKFQTRTFVSQLKQAEIINHFSYIRSTMLLIYSSNFSWNVFLFLFFWHLNWNVMIHPHAMREESKVSTPLVDNSCHLIKIYERKMLPNWGLLMLCFRYDFIYFFFLRD